MTVIHKLMRLVDSQTSPEKKEKKRKEKKKNEKEKKGSREPEIKMNSWGCATRNDVCASASFFDNNKKNFKVALSRQ